jgi:hypothetical protein
MEAGWLVGGRMSLDGERKHDRYQVDLCTEYQHRWQARTDDDAQYDVSVGIRIKFR